MDLKRAGDQKTVGRIIGAIVLVQLALGITINAVLTAPLFSGDGYLVNGAANGTQLGFSVLLALAGTGLSLALALLARPVLRTHSEAAATAFLAVTVVGMAMSCVEQVGILAMRDFSEVFVAGDEAQRELLASMSVAGAVLRNGAHYVSLMVSGATLGIWYYCLLRFVLVPWPLAALGLIAVCLQLFSISQPILGGVVPFILLAPLALAQLLHGAWLLLFGFRGGASVASDGAASR